MNEEQSARSVVLAFKQDFVEAVERLSRPFRGNQPEASRRGRDLLRDVV